MKFFAVLSAVLAVAVASPATWTIHELSEALQDYSTDDHLVPYLEQALNDLMDQIYAGNPAPTTTVSSAVQDFSYWSLNELSEAIQDPATDPALLPYLEHGLNILMDSLFAEHHQEYVIIATPVGLLPVEVAVPILPAPVEEPVAPAPVEAPAVPAPASSPLVQLIVNVNSQAPAPAPVVVPSPVVIPSPDFIPSPAVIPSPDIIAVNPIDLNA